MNHDSAAAVLLPKLLPASAQERPLLTGQGRLRYQDEREREKAQNGGRAGRAYSNGAIPRWPGRRPP
jgi:hypothetical protein